MTVNKRQASASKAAETTVYRHELVMYGLFFSLSCVFERKKIPNNDILALPGGSTWWSGGILHCLPASSRLPWRHHIIRLEYKLSLQSVLMLASFLQIASGFSSKVISMLQTTCLHLHAKYNMWMLLANSFICSNYNSCMKLPWTWIEKGYRDIAILQSCKPVDIMVENDRSSLHCQAFWGWIYSYKG